MHRLKAGTRPACGWASKTGGPGCSPGMLLRECCFSIRPNRGKDVVEAFLGEHRPDFWVSDRLAAQMGWAQKADRPRKGR